MVLVNATETYYMLEFECPQKNVLKKILESLTKPS